MGRRHGVCVCACVCVTSSSVMGGLACHLPPPQKASPVSLILSGIITCPGQWEKNTLAVEDSSFPLFSYSLPNEQTVGDRIGDQMMTGTDRLEEHHALWSGSGETRWTWAFLGMTNIFPAFCNFLSAMPSHCLCVACSISSISHLALPFSLLPTHTHLACTATAFAFCLCTHLLPFLPIWEKFHDHYACIDICLLLFVATLTCIMTPT